MEPNREEVGVRLDEGLQERVGGYASREGLTVGAALQRSWLPRAADQLQRLAAFAVGLAIPVVGAWVLRDAPREGRAVTVGLAAAGALSMVAPWTRTRVTGVRLGLVLVAVALLLMGGTG